MYASCHGHFEIVEKLIKKKAKINYTRQDGNNAFLCACYYTRENIIKILLDNNVDVTSVFIGNTGL